MTRGKHGKKVVRYCYFCGLKGARHRAEALEVGTIWFHRECSASAKAKAVLSASE